MVHYGFLESRWLVRVLMKGVRLQGALTAEGPSGARSGACPYRRWLTFAFGANAKKYLVR